MTMPAEAVSDPVGTVVSLVAAADPALGHDLVRRVVEQVGGGGPSGAAWPWSWPVTRRC